MHIINTNKKSKVIKSFYFRLVLLLFTFCLFTFSIGCLQKGNLQQVQDYARQSQVYYQQAVNIYKDLIARGEDLDRLNLELGSLYLGHGEFRQAIKAFKSSHHAQAKKFLAICYYRSGNFTDALEIFNKSTDSIN